MNNMFSWVLMVGGGGGAASVHKTLGLANTGLVERWL